MLKVLNGGFGGLVGFLAACVPLQTDFVAITTQTSSSITSIPVLLTEVVIVESNGSNSDYEGRFWMHNNYIRSLDATIARLRKGSIGQGNQTVNLGVRGSAGKIARRKGASAFLLLLMMSLPLIATPAVAFSGSEVVSHWPCGAPFPSGTIVDPYKNNALLPNGTVVDTSPADTNSPLCSLQGSFNTGPNYFLGEGLILTSPISVTYTYFQDSWTVPSAPTGSLNGYSQNSAFWNGLEDTTKGHVVQPLMVYGCALHDRSNHCVVGGNYWYIIPWAHGWNCNQGSGTECWGTLIKVSVGDSIVGILALNQHTTFCPSDGPSYSIGAGDSTIGQTNTLILCDTDVYHAAAAGVLEVNNLDSCNQLPNASSLSFSSIAYTTTGGGTITHSADNGGHSFCSNNAYWNPSYTTLNLVWSP